MLPVVLWTLTRVHYRSLLGSIVGAYQGPFWALLGYRMLGDFVILLSTGLLLKKLI